MEAETTTKYELVEYAWDVEACWLGNYQILLHTTAVGKITNPQIHSMHSQAADSSIPKPPQHESSSD
jgi:hypothetical protein